jgi:tetratricopeptide (TPR) repeat protein
MASAVSNSDHLSPGIRRRLQEQYERGKQNRLSRNYDYAAEMLTQCVLGDPGNPFYTQEFLHTLFCKYTTAKSAGMTAGLRTATSKTSMLNSSRKRDWAGLIKTGLEVLKVNPWDSSALMLMARACGERGFVKSQLMYLEKAKDVDPKNYDVWWERGLALEKDAQFDDAVKSWLKAESVAKVASEEADRAHRAISRLQVDLTMKSNVQQDEAKHDNTGSEAAVDEIQRWAAAGLKINKRTRAEELLEKIAATPGEYMLYCELSDIHERTGDYSEAEGVLNRGLDATGDLRIREQLEDVQIRHRRHQLLVAQRRFEELKNAEAKQQVQQISAELNNQEMEVYRKRVDRYPTNTHWKYEAGTRLKRAGNYNEAIKMLQDARNDPKHRGMVFLELGECFQQVQQFKLAKQHYVDAVEAIGDRDLEHRKKAMYRAGVLTMALAVAEPAGVNQEELDDAEKYFSQLAALDFGYRDVSARLDKIAKLRDKR